MRNMELRMDILPDIRTSQGSPGSLTSVVCPGLAGGNQVDDRRFFKARSAGRTVAKCDSFGRMNRREFVS